MGKRFQSKTEPLTKEKVFSLPSRDGTQTLYWSRELVNFGIRVSSSGKRVYIIQARVSGDDRNFVYSRRISVGRCDVLSYEDAMAMAKAGLAEFYRGVDPSTTKGWRNNEA